MKFGSSSIAWPISNADFLLQQLSSDSCVGAFFALSTAGTSAPPWIVGDTFLKNVYSVFRSSPASVGFATLSADALAMNGKSGAAPSATVGAVSATVTGSTANSGTDRSSSANGAPKSAGASAYALWGVALLSGLVGGAVML